MAIDSPLLDNNVNSPPSVVHHEEEKPLKIVHKFAVESKKLWKIAGPTIITALSQYSLGAFTSTFVGHVNELDLAAFSVENSVIAGFAFGFLVCKLFSSPFYSYITLVFFSKFTHIKMLNCVELRVRTHISISDVTVVFYYLCCTYTTHYTYL